MLRNIEANGIDKLLCDVITKFSLHIGALFHAAIAIYNQRLSFQESTSYFNGK